MLAEFIIDPSSRSMGLKNMAFEAWREMTHIEDLIGKGKKQITMDEVAIESAAPMRWPTPKSLCVSCPSSRKLERVNGEKLLEEIDLPLTPVLADMEMTGIALDLPFFVETGQAPREAHGTRSKSRSMSGGQTVQHQLDAAALRCPLQAAWARAARPGNKTASGHFSTSAGVLDLLRGKHPVVDLILEHRELSKIKSTYVDALQAALNSEPAACTPPTARSARSRAALSSSNPNLQNIPIRTEEGRRIRHGFVAGKGNVLLSVDYSQIELRIVAHMAQDEGMLAAFPRERTSTPRPRQPFTMSAPTKSPRICAAAPRASTSA